MNISLIAAMTPERVIGSGNSLPWHLPADLAWFKQHTLYKPILMGRKTYQSIGKPLPQRHNIVLSHQPIHDPGITWVNSLAAGCEAASSAEELMVIGGGRLYQQLLSQANRLYVTLIEATLPGDVYFPDYTPSRWVIQFSDYHLADARNAYACRFMILDRLECTADSATPIE
ncbi:type 3 dihydrofolate reductase [unidentified bacterial endosymbiont]|uniref:type 3 dihydrofolate reductase n=1 Tax=unidentified bacterial endosymbiont TaxID=2355 RepID=UPI00209E0340|nr:type 3 dihydrofolate reductase [unidentified bacterial endosymbiont]